MTSTMVCRKSDSVQTQMSDPDLSHLFIWTSQYTSNIWTRKFILIPITSYAWISFYQFSFSGNYSGVTVRYLGGIPPQSNTISTGSITADNWPESWLQDVSERCVPETLKAGYPRKHGHEWFQKRLDAPESRLVNDPESWILACKVISGLMVCMVYVGNIRADFYDNRP